ncbi:MAG: tail fiber domain-containing protein [Bacteroidota bacterium]
MKNSLILLVFYLLSIPAYSQLKVVQSGDVGIGTVTTPTSKLHVDGDSYFIGSSASKGFYFTSYYGCPVIKPELNHSMYIGLYNNQIFSIRTKYLYVSNLPVYSDQSLKENILPITNSLARISKINGYNYDLKAEIYENSDPRHKEELLKDRFNQTGFIAQELMIEFPELVKLDKESGLYTINYIALIPHLVEAIKEQQVEIDELKNQLATDPSEKGTSELQTSIYSSDIVESATLLQNIPNPFNENTTIKYVIPEIQSYAMINVYDLQGRQVKSYSIEQTGEGDIMIPGSELNPGLFIYNLIVDGVEVASRRMILTE